MANEVTIKFGGINIDDASIFCISSVEIQEKKSVNTHKIPKSDGSIAETARREALTISMKGTVTAADYDALRTNIDTLKAALHNGLQKFITDDDRYIMAQLDSFIYSYVKMRLLAEWSASFVAHFPFWLAETETTDERVPTSGSGYTINNPGNAPVRIKVEVTAPAGGITDNCQIENTTRGELLKYRGTIAATKKLEIDNRYDTDDFQVLNDGVDDHKNFEGDFLMLSPGNNTIEYTGTAGATVKVYFRAGYY